MKKTAILKTIPVAIFASACLATSAAAYLDMGDSISYSVKSNAPDWDNQNNTWAWYLHTPADCEFNGTGTSGCVANYNLYQWTFGKNKRYVTGRTGVSNGFAVPIKQEKLVEDDYFAEVTYVSGGVNTGILRFWKVQ